MALLYSSSSFFFLLVALCSWHLPFAFAQSNCKAWLVQSIPTDMPDLHLVPGVLSTADVLQWLAGNATKSLDLTVQYWELLAEPNNSKSGDYGYSEADMKKFGADSGRQVYQSLVEAADRNVGIRIIQHSGLYPDFVEEASDLAAGRPNVKNITLLLSNWWGTGIVHCKVWISDNKDIYIGSANNDWKSLTQVKELGIYLVGCSKIAQSLRDYLDNLFTLSTLNSMDYTRTIFDSQWQASRKVPCWSNFIPKEEQCRSPLPPARDVPHVNGYPIIDDPATFDVSIETPGVGASTASSDLSYLSFAPPELLFGKFQSDEQGWIETIKSVKVGGTLRISTMDWLGQSQFANPIIFWDSLAAAISEVVFAKNATVHLLTANWTHSPDSTDKYLKNLLYTNVLCSSSKYNHCGGKIEIRYYIIPGYDKTGPAIINGTATGNLYPGYTRVNHGKYAVSDVRAHIGTSNLIWDYFYSTAGVSFGTYKPSIVTQVQQVFDADWNSPYTQSVQPLSAQS
ncbi:phospholipase D Z-like protein [Carex littledalei]|uniref:Phospholipase D Z-like protein n=1 Tax=Carex littledalei TaxID=544730 RepID=A0A833QNB0_9POAL|nr:phospholipase D Z-like protein [Carex littledalei]